MKKLTALKIAYVTGIRKVFFFFINFESLFSPEMMMMVIILSGSAVYPYLAELVSFERLHRKKIDFIAS